MMLKVVLLLVYLLDGEIKIEQLPQKDMESCEKNSKALIHTREMHPKFNEGIIAACVTSVIKEA